MCFLISSVINSTRFCHMWINQTKKCNSCFSFFFYFILTFSCSPFLLMGRNRSTKVTRIAAFQCHSFLLMVKEKLMVGSLTCWIPRGTSWAAGGPAPDCFSPPHTHKTSRLSELWSVKNKAMNYLLSLAPPTAGLLLLPLPYLLLLPTPCPCFPISLFLALLPFPKTLFYPSHSPVPSLRLSFPPVWNLSTMICNIS